MRIEKIIDDIIVYIIPKLHPDDILVLSTPNLWSPRQAEALHKVMGRILPDNKWVIFNSDDLSIKIEKELK